MLDCTLSSLTLPYFIGSFHFETRSLTATQAGLKSVSSHLCLMGFRCAPLFLAKIPIYLLLLVQILCPQEALWTLASSAGPHRQMVSSLQPQHCPFPRAHGLSILQAEPLISTANRHEALRVFSRLQKSPLPPCNDSSLVTHLPQVFALMCFLLPPHLAVIPA